MPLDDIYSTYTLKPIGMCIGSGYYGSVGISPMEFVQTQEPRSVLAETILLQWNPSIMDTIGE